MICALLLHTASIAHIVQHFFMHNAKHSRMQKKLFEFLIHTYKIRILASSENLEKGNAAIITN